MRFQEFSQFKIRPYLFENKQQYKQIMDTMVNNGIIEQSQAQKFLKEAKSLLKRSDRIIWWLRWFRLKTTGADIEGKIEEIERNYEFDERNNLLGTDQSVFNSKEEAKQEKIGR